MATAGGRAAALCVLLAVLLILLVYLVAGGRAEKLPTEGYRGGRPGFSPRSPPRRRNGGKTGAARYRTEEGYPGALFTGAPDTALPLAGAAPSSVQLDLPTGKKVVPGRGSARPGRVRFDAAVRAREIEAL